MELAVIVAVAGIVAAIAIPNYLEAMTRRNVARTKSEIRSLAVALECYYIDNCSYPPSMSSAGILCSTGGLPSATRDFWTIGYVPFVLTTFVAYRTELPFDRFAPRCPYDWSRTYPYAALFYSYWIITSRGPDRDTGDIEISDYIIPPVRGHIRKIMAHYSGTSIEYDPSNGTISSGDIFRTGP